MRDYNLTTQKQGLEPFMAPKDLVQFRTGFSPTVSCTDFVSGPQDRACPVLIIETVYTLFYRLTSPRESSIEIQSVK